MAAALLTVILVPALVILRTEQIKSRTRQQIAARTLERERIARDLHDTLLQGAQSLLLQTSIWASDPSLSPELRSEIRQASEQARQIVIEGRDRIAVLRGSGKKEADLIAALNTFAGTRSGGELPHLEIITRGAPRLLTFEAYQQLVDIAREAIRNAIQHAKCRRVQALVEYRPRLMVLTVSDDGCGISPYRLQDVEAGAHFGVQGMRERARQLGATFNVGTNGALGSAVTVHVPADVAYSDSSRTGWARITSLCRNIFG